MIMSIRKNMLAIYAVVGSGFIGGYSNKGIVYGIGIGLQYNFINF